jgi:hypothetical protein
MPYLQNLNTRILKSKLNNEKLNPSARATDFVTHTHAHKYIHTYTLPHMYTQK